MSYRKLSIALASAGFLSLAVTSPVQAGALATSVLQMDNFVILHSSGTAYDISDFQAIVPNSSANISANYNGANDSAAAPGTPTGQIDLLPVCVGPSCPGVVNNVFPQLTAPPLGNFSAADQNESGSPLTGQTLGGVAIPLGAIVESGSWVILENQSAGPNATSATNQLSTQFAFTLLQADSLTFQFDAQLYQEAFLSPDINFPGQSITSSQFFFQIRNQAGTLIFDFSPNGVVGDGIGVNADIDPFSLNASAAINAPFNQIISPQQIIDSGGFGNYSATTAVLNAGELYTLTATLKTTADASFVLVPEPGIMGLLGLGLLGMGIAVRRKSA